MSQMLIHNFKKGLESTAKLVDNLFFDNLFIENFQNLHIFLDTPKKTDKLDTWLKKAKQLDVIELNSFINLIESDIEAVKNAIIYNFSDGLTEGFNNKTKVIKRQMYGRCNFDLLRLKILA